MLCMGVHTHHHTCTETHTAHTLHLRPWDYRARGGQLLPVLLHHPVVVPSSPGVQQGLEVPQSPCRGPHQPCGYSKRHRRPSSGERLWGGWLAQRWMPERWENSEVKKQEENPNQAMGTQACEGERQPARARPKQTAKEAE